MKNIIIYLFCSFFLNCDNKKESQYLEIYYMGPNISTPYSYSCSEIYEDKSKEKINYKKIDDQQQVKTFMNLFNQYQISNDSSGIDSRIKILIYNKSKIDTLCLGEYFNTYRNGIKVEDNKQLLNFVKEIIDYENTVPAFVKKHPERYKNK
ncbi:hypothetical protein J2X31_003709 [Flavobacterium arsenatis]|uniref:Lipoprotein n=1 Tax=Flavobacterium arsenatis TaxID=1484332 RepID=A0ABU1TUX6_9FLAO|nr:hypothetical protein [Flavobacterium arsenatis]MDR6969675.1 hypothetical protein [Flavobacterium arsenatis]